MLLWFCLRSCSRQTTTKWKYKMLRLYKKGKARERAKKNRELGVTGGGGKDETGNTYGLLTVNKKAPPKIFPNGILHSAWYCKYSCGNPELIVKTGNYLRTAEVTQSYGCAE